MISLEIIKHIRPAVGLLSIFTVVTGLLYPLVLSGIAQGLFPRQANGSLIEADGRVIGSELIGQSFINPKYFWGRPSATTPVPYNAGASAGSNLGPTNPELVKQVKERIAQLHRVDPQNSSPIPIDLVTASASGLDPDISSEAALYQVPRVARARRLMEIQVRKLIIGSARVNVLKLNLALDALSASSLR